MNDTHFITIDHAVSDKYNKNKELLSLRIVIILTLIILTLNEPATIRF